MKTTITKTTKVYDETGRVTEETITTEETESPDPIQYPNYPWRNPYTYNPGSGVYYYPNYLYYPYVPVTITNGINATEASESVAFVSKM